MRMEGKDVFPSWWHFDDGRMPSFYARTTPFELWPRRKEAGRDGIGFLLHR